MIIKIFETALPVLVMIVLGYVCHAKSFIDIRGLQGLKSLISNITLPVVLFNAFFCASYSSRTLVLFVVIYTGFGAALAAGFILKRFNKKHARFMPFLLSGAEGGMLGYALYGLITGAQAEFATVDLGQTIFAYTTYLAFLKASDGQQVSANLILKNMMTNKCFVGMLLGIIGGASGLGSLLQSSFYGGIYTALTGMIATPTSAIVLIVVGYELNLKKDLLKPVLKTVLSRVLIMGTLLVLISFLSTKLFGFDKDLQVALMILYALPAPFIIPMFAEVGEEGEYISTTLSVNTLLTLLLFIGISTYYIAV